MKKLSLLLVVLLAAGSAGLYGQMAIGTNFSISGDAKATAGYDIDDEQFGFKNESNSNIKIELVAKQSADNSETVGMSGWVGSIELKDFQIVIDSGEEETELLVTEDGDPASVRSKLYVVEPTIVAKLKNGPLFLQIFDKPESKADLIGHIEEDDPDDDDRKAESDDDGNDVGVELDGQGVTVGYETDDLRFAVGLASEEAYDAEQGSFVVSADMKVNVGPATLDVAVVQGIENSEEESPDDKDDDTGVGMKLTGDFGDLSLSAGADIEITHDENTATGMRDMYWEVGGTATVTLNPNTSLTTDFIHSTKDLVATDVAVNLSDKSGLVESLDMSVEWGLFDIDGGRVDAAQDLNEKMDMFVEGKVDYHVSDTLGGTLTPGTTVTINQLDGGDAIVGLELRAVLTEAVPAATFGLAWKTDQFIDTDSMEREDGTVTVWTKIVY